MLDSAICSSFDACRTNARQGKRTSSRNPSRASWPIRRLSFCAVRVQLPWQKCLELDLLHQPNLHSLALRASKWTTAPRALPACRHSHQTYPINYLPLTTHSIISKDSPTARAFATLKVQGSWSSQVYLHQPKPINLIYLSRNCRTGDNKLRQ